MKSIRENSSRFLLSYPTTPPPSPDATNATVNLVGRSRVWAWRDDERADDTFSQQKDKGQPHVMVKEPGYLPYPVATRYVTLDDGVDSNMGESRDDQAWDDFRASGADTDVSVGFGASKKGNSYSRRNPVQGNKRMVGGPVSSPDFNFTKNREFEGIDDIDTSDTPVAPMRQVRKGPPPIPDRRPVMGKNRLPGLPPQREADEPQPVSAIRRRQSSPTQQITPVQQAPSQSSPSGKWDVTLPDGRVLKIPASSAQVAQKIAGNWLKANPAHATRPVGSQGQAPTPMTGRPMNFDYSRFQVVPSNEGTGAGALGGQPQTPYEEALHRAVRDMVREVVRKKEGGGGYVLYGPNKGKKKAAKPAGEFPTRLAAKRAELARFPPKDPEQLKKARKRLDKLLKDPKKRAAAEKQDLSGRKKPKKVGKPSGERAKRKESFVRMIAKDLQERLFHEDEVPGSPWDERIGSLHPDHISSDRKLHSLHKGIEKASLGALGDAHKGLAKVLRGMAIVHPGDVAVDPERKKTFMPVVLDVDGVEIGPMHLYIDGGHVKIEVSRDARQQISELEPDFARDLRGGLMTFEEDHLPKIDKAQLAYRDRDTYLDKLHGRLEKHASGLSGVEHHLLKQLLSKGGKKR